ncbi:hypothetical protein U3516DRAFT_800283 [Neocallimastix sp. 'constans']
MKISSTNQGKCIFPLNCNTIFNENRNIISNINQYFELDENIYFMNYNKFLEIFLSLLYKNIKLNSIEIIKHKKITSFSLSNYINELFNCNPQNHFIKNYIIEDNSCKEILLKPLDDFEQINETEKINYFKYYELIGNILNNIITDKPLFQFYQTFFTIDQNNFINTKFVSNVHTLIYDRLLKENQQNKEMFFDIIKRFFISMVYTTNKICFQHEDYSKIILIYSDIIKNLMSTSYGYMILQKYNILDKFTNSPRGIYDLILKSDDIYDFINSYINDIQYYINNDILYILNNSFLYKILSFQNICSLLPIEKINSNKNEQNYLLSFIQLSLNLISDSSNINIKVNK